MHGSVFYMAPLDRADKKFAPKPRASYEVDGPPEVGHRGFHAFADLVCVFIDSPLGTPVWEVRLGRDVLTTGTRSCSTRVQFVSCLHDDEVARAVGGVQCIKRGSDKLHFVDGLLVKYKVMHDGSQVVGYRRHGVSHRDGGLPAVQWGGGMYGEWWVDGLRHRVGGPAVVDKNRHEFWDHGVLLSFRLLTPSRSLGPGSDSDDSL